MTRPEITARQASCLTFVKGFIRTRGYSPSIKEVADALGLASTASADRLVWALVRKGYLRRPPNTSRALVVIEEVA